MGEIHQQKIYEAAGYKDCLRRINEWFSGLCQNPSSRGPIEDRAFKMHPIDGIGNIEFKVGVDYSEKKLLHWLRVEIHRTLKGKRKSKFAGAFDMEDIPGGFDINHREIFPDNKFGSINRQIGMATAGLDILEMLARTANATKVVMDLRTEGHRYIQIDTLALALKRGYYFADQPSLETAEHIVRGNYQVFENDEDNLVIETATQFGAAVCNIVKQL